MEYFELFKQLHERSVRYLVCGGLAVNIYGIPRMTADIDLLLDFEHENLSRFETMVQDFGYQAIIPSALSEYLDEEKRMKAALERNLFAFSYYNTRASYMTLDILMHSPISFQELWARRETRKLEAFDVTIVSIEDLIALKQYSNRTQDQQDVMYLKSMLKGEF